MFTLTLLSSSFCFVFYFLSLSLLFKEEKCCYLFGKSSIRLIVFFFFSLSLKLGLREVSNIIDKIQSNSNPSFATHIYMCI